MTAAIKMIHLDIARQFSGHATRCSFRRWFKRAKARHPGIIVICRRLYIEEATFHQLHRADSDFIEQIANPAASTAQNKHHRRATQPHTHPTPRPVVLPLTRRTT